MLPSCHSLHKAGTQRCSRSEEGTDVEQLGPGWKTHTRSFSCEDVNVAELMTVTVCNRVNVSCNATLATSSCVWQIASCPPATRAKESLRFIFVDEFRLATGIRTKKSSIHG